MYFEVLDPAGPTTTTTFMLAAAAGLGSAAKPPNAARANARLSAIRRIGRLEDARWAPCSGNRQFSCLLSAGTPRWGAVTVGGAALGRARDMTDDRSGPTLGRRDGAMTDPCRSIRDRRALADSPAVTGICRGGGVFGWACLSGGCLGGAEYASRVGAMSSRTLVPGHWARDAGPALGLDPVRRPFRLCSGRPNPGAAVALACARGRDTQEPYLTFDSLGLSADLLQTVAEEGYHTPTPVQADAIPLVLQGRDLLAAAQTGTGKTAAFVLPILDRMRQHANTSFSPARHPVRVLILVPTRELAMQVDASVRTYGRTVPLRSTVVYGGIPIEPQIKALRAGIEILVATPGRLLDHVGQRTVNLGLVEILVLDEADRMLDMGFLPGHPADPRAAPAEAPEPAVLGHLLGGHPEPVGLDPARSGASRGRAPATPRRRRSASWSIPWIGIARRRSSRT